VGSFWIKPQPLGWEKYKYWVSACTYGNVPLDYRVFCALLSDHMKTLNKAPPRPWISVRRRVQAYFWSVA